MIYDGRANKFLGEILMDSSEDLIKRVRRRRRRRFSANLRAAPSFVLKFLYGWSANRFGGGTARKTFVRAFTRSARSKRSETIYWLGASPKTCEQFFSLASAGKSQSGNRRLAVNEISGGNSPDAEMLNVECRTLSATRSAKLTETKDSFVLKILQH